MAWICDTIPYSITLAQRNGIRESGQLLPETNGVESIVVMDWIFFSLSIVLATGGTAAIVLYFAQRWYTIWLHERVLHEKQLAVYEEIAELVGRVKATLEYTSGDETLGAWRTALMVPLRDMLCKSYEWAVFLPSELQDLPSQYASKLARALSQFDGLGPKEFDAYAGLIDEMKQVEKQAAADMQARIRTALGIKK